MTNDTPSSDNKRRKTHHDWSDDSGAARSALQTKTVNCDQSRRSDRPHVDTKNAQIFTKGETVFYTSSQGFAEEALVVEVHFDDLLVPYYTIRLLNGDREKQTNGARITTLSNLCRWTTPFKPLQSILRPSSYGRDRKVLPVTPDCQGDDWYMMSSSSKNFLQSIETKLSQRKARNKRDAQVVTPDSVCETNHRLNVRPNQLVYTGARKRKRPYDDDLDDATRVRKRRKIATIEVESSSNEGHSLPFHFMPRTSMISSSTWNFDGCPRTYPAMVPSFPIDWPTNGGGYCAISFHNKHSQSDIRHSIVHQMLVFEEILSKLEKEASESLRAATSSTSFLSTVAKFLSNYWECIKSKFSFKCVSVKHTSEVIASDPLKRLDSDQPSSKAAVANVAQRSTSTAALQTNLLRKEQSIATISEVVTSKIAVKPVVPRPPDRWKNIFAVKAGHWKCKSCFYQNPQEAMTCDVCTALRDDLSQYDTQTDVAPSDVARSAYSHSDDSQTRSSQTVESRADDTRTEDSSTDDGTQITINIENEYSQTDCSVKSSEDNSHDKEATKKSENFDASSVDNDNTKGRRLSSLALALERIRADRAINAAFNANHYASAEQSSLSGDVDSETNRSKRLRGNIESIESSAFEASVERAAIYTDPFLLAPMETDVYETSVASNVSTSDKAEMMELDCEFSNKRSNFEVTLNGKKQKFV